MYQMNKVRLDLKQAADKIARKEGERDILNKQHDQAERQHQEAQKRIGTYDLVQILLQKTSDYARQQAKIRIEEIVTSALGVVFGKDYRFIIELDVKGNQPVAEYWLQSEGVTTHLKPPDYDRGGGVADVVSLALRLAVGELTGVKGPLFLDEVGKHVSQEYAPNVAYFLKEYGQKFDRQIILITHNQHLADVGDVSLGVKQDKGRSEVVPI